MRFKTTLIVATAVAGAAALTLGAGEAGAQAVFQCPAASPPATAVFPAGTNLRALTEDNLRAFFRAFPRPTLIPTEPVDCGFVDVDRDRYVVVENPRITVTEDWVPGITAWRQRYDARSDGDLVIYVRSVDPTGKAVHFHPLDHGRYAVRTMGDGDFNTGELSHGVSAEHRGGRGRVGIDFRNMSLSTAGGDDAYGIYALQQGSYFFENGRTHRARGAVVINVIETERDRPSRARPLIATRGDESDAIRAEYTRAAAYGHIAVTVKGYTIATGGIAPKGPQIPNTGDEGGMLLPSLTGYNSRGVYANHEGLGDIRIAVTDSHVLTWGVAAHGIFADHEGRTVTATAEDGSPSVTSGGGAVDIDLKDGEIRTAGEGAIGVYGSHLGAGDIVIDATGAVIATTGDESHGVQAWIRQATTAEGDATVPVAGTGEGDIAVSMTGGSISTGAGSTFAVWGRHDHRGDVAVTVAGDAATTGDRAHAVLAEHRGSAGDVALTVGGGAVATTGDGAHGAHAKQAGGGATTVSVTGGSVTARGEKSNGVLALGSGDGDVTVRVTGGEIAARGAESHGVEAWSRAGNVAVAIDGGAVAAHGAGGAGVLARSLATAAGKGRVTVSVGPAGRVSAASGIAIYSDGPTDLNATVAGRVEGDIFHSGDGVLVLQLPESGVVTGTVHDPRGPFTVRGSIGRLFYSAGASVTVAPGGKLTGVEIEFDGERQVQALRSTAGEVTAAVQGRVTGNIVVDGDGRLAVTVTGTVDGDLIQTGDGALVLSVPEGGVVTGTVHDPESPLVVGGSVGRLLYNADGAVTVARTGKLTGVETTVDGETRPEALRSAAGAATATVHGAVDGVIRLLGSGDHTIAIERGGRATAPERRAAAAAAAVGNNAAAAGEAILHTNGNLTATVGGAVVGHIVSDSGRLVATVAGTVDGDIRALGSGDHALTLESGSVVTGTVRRATPGAITAGGAVGRLRFDRGGLAVIGEKGRILGIDGNGVWSGRGELVVEVRQGAGETAADALLRALAGGITVIEVGGRPVLRTRAPGEDARVLGAHGTAASAPDGAYDVGLVLRADGSVFISREFAPRSRVYETLPSVLLALNAPLTVGERMAAPRDSNGVWGRIEGAHGSWKAARSTTGAEYDLLRHGVWTGLETPVDDAGSVLGFSLHHRGGTADAPRGGEIDAQGFGVTMHGGLRRDGLYLDGQASATWYETSFESFSRGRLADDIRGYGYALGVEAGRRMAVGEVSVTPRARLVHSEVSVSDFEDKTGARVSLNEGRSLRGRVGVGVEAQPLGNRIRLSGGVDVEREFEDARQVTVEGTPLPATDRATRLLLGLGGATGWGDGRYTLAGKLDYATSEDGENTEIGGGLNLTMRF